MNGQVGTVSIVGAGPGDPELLTRKAHQRIQTADVILHDALVGDAIIAKLPETATVINVGKRPGGKRTSQAEINRLLVREAHCGRAVVRLKGGDPFIFGRGGEEAEYLAKQDIPLEIIPGISSVLAGASVSGIPLTHRDHASSLTVITGHEDPTKSSSALDWSAIAETVQAGGTLVILMGVRRLAENMAVLQANGLPTTTPVAMVEQASLAREFTIMGTVSDIADRAEGVGIEPPAITIVGEVVRVGEGVADCLGAVPASQMLAEYPELVEGEINQ